MHIYGGLERPKTPTFLRSDELVNHSNEDSFGRICKLFLQQQKYPFERISKSFEQMKFSLEKIRDSFGRDKIFFELTICKTCIIIRCRETERGEGRERGC